MMFLDIYEDIETENSEKSNLKVNQRIHLVKDLTVPFSFFSKKIERSEIYSGNEKIPFEEKDSLFKSILRKEFSDAINDFYKKKDKTECV